jgi:hypothetical protein
MLNLGAGRGWVVSTMPQPLYPWERPGWVGPRAGLDVCKKSCPSGIRSRDHLPRSQSLYRLSYLENLYYLTYLFFTQRTLRGQDWYSRSFRNTWGDASWVALLNACLEDWGKPTCIRFGSSSYDLLVLFVCVFHLVFTPGLWYHVCIMCVYLSYHL